MKTEAGCDTIKWNPREVCVDVLDQRLLPHKVSVVQLKSSDDAARAISDMIVRGAPLIGVTAAYGFYLATLEATQENFPVHLEEAYRKLLSTRPTAVNLKWALVEMMKSIEGEKDIRAVRQKSLAAARKIELNDIEMCRMIGVHGLGLIRKISASKMGAPVNILTHCNAGRLACVQWGTATSPMYHAHLAGIKIHVWVDETRPRNQGASLTAYELVEAGIEHTLIADNTGGLLMQKGMVDLVIVGADRVAENGDVANKIGTYLKALAAADNNVPFYVAFPSSTFDVATKTGSDIEIEERAADEVNFVSGNAEGKIVAVRISPEKTPAKNFGFDITPARMITGYITEKGIHSATELRGNSV